MEFTKLNNGIEMPLLGFGVYQAYSKGDCLHSQIFAQGTYATEFRHFRFPAFR